MFEGIEITWHTILRLIGVVTAGILLFDLILLLFTDNHITITRGVIQAGKEYPATAVTLCAAICFLIWHFWGA